MVAPEGREDDLPPGKLGLRMNAIMQRNGLISRNMQDAMAFCPPLIITPVEMIEILAITRQSLHELASDVSVAP